MSIYMKAYDGYITDVPIVWFKRNDGRVFCFDNLTNFSLTPDQETSKISAGWGNTPVAYIPSRSSIEATFTTPEFTTDQFSLSGGIGSEVDEDVEEFEIDHLVSSENLLSTPYDNIEIDTVDVYGYEYVDRTPEAREFTIVRNFDGGAVLYIDDGRADRDTTAMLGIAILDKMILNDGNEPLSEYVTYIKENRNARSIQFDNKHCAVGECVIRYPVYSGSEDCMEPAIKGYLVVKIFKARIDNRPGFNSSYKDTNEFTLTIKGMDAKREDKQQYVIGYYSI